jgi:DNA modification methylase
MIRQLIGDCRAILPSLSDESVHCVVTSPPYWGLRDYGTAIWEGGDLGCDHVERIARKDGQRSYIEAFHGSPAPDSNKGSMHYRSECGHCGARRIDSQLGLEATYQEHVATMLAVFREVRRVLRRDGTLWLNYGDSYASTPSGHKTGPDGRIRPGIHDLNTTYDDRTFTNKPFSTIQGALKPKDLCGIPWRVAFALQADGWWLRQDIIWSKPNPMPESVSDRCTKAHEYLFLLAKSERYYFDAAAIREEAEYGRREQPAKTWDRCKEQRVAGATKGAEPEAGRNKRSVWHIATAPYSEAHFATFPPALIEPCILAGCPKGGTVLDPFSGAGTTGLVADRLQRNAILIDLNGRYAGMAAERIRGDAPLFVDLE